MITLDELRKEYGYTILDSNEVGLIREHKVNWSGLNGEVIRRKILRSYPAYLQAVNFGYQMTPYHYSMAANLQREFERGPNPKPGLEQLVKRLDPYDPSRPDLSASTP